MIRRIRSPGAGWSQLKFLLCSRFVPFMIRSIVLFTFCSREGFYRAGAHMGGKSNVAMGIGC